MGASYMISATKYPLALWMIPMEFGESVFILHLCITVLTNNNYYLTVAYCSWSWRRGVYIVMALGAFLLCPQGGHIPLGQPCIPYHEG